MATAFKEKSPLLPLPVEDPGTCPHCGKVLISRLGVLTAARESAGKWWHVPKFADRFSGCNFPLSKAAGLKGIEAQLPLDHQIAGDQWDFKKRSRGSSVWMTWRHRWGSDVVPLGPGSPHVFKAAGKGFWNRAVFAILGRRISGTSLRCNGGDWHWSTGEKERSGSRWSRGACAGI